MAGNEERAHAERLLKIHRRNLRRLEEQKALQAGATNLALDNQIEEERANIIALEPIANPTPLPSPKIQEFVKNSTPGEIDNVMLFIQGNQINTRVTTWEESQRRIDEKVEGVIKQVEGVVKQLEGVLEAQHDAQRWRVDIADHLRTSDIARIYGQRRNFRISLGNIALILFVLLLVIILFVRAGLL